MAPRRKFFRLPWRTSRQIGADVDEELRFHFDARIADLVGSGMTPDAARMQALREFGDVEDARRYLTTIDQSTEAATRRSEYMSDFWNDLTYAARKLRKAPAFTLTAILTLALGIGANTAIFSAVNSVLLRPLPYPEADNLVRVRFTEAGHGDAGTPMDLVDYRTQATTFEDFAMMEPSALNLVEPGHAPERLSGVRVSAPWFKLLRTRPLTGRFFSPDEDKAGAAKVAVLSERVWRNRFGGDSSILNRSIELNGQPYRVIGVAAAQDQYPLTVDVFVPRVFGPDDLSDQSRGARWLGMLGRLKEGTSIETATADLRRIGVGLNQRFPNQYDRRFAQPVTIREFIVGSIRKPLWVVMGAVGLVLLIACANVANLLLVRATSREGELAVRTALGAGEGRLVRQLVTEAMLLTVIGGAVGVAIAVVGMKVLIGMASTSLPMLARTTMDGTTLAATAAISLLTGIVFGVLPAHQVTRGSLANSLKAGARGTPTRPGTLRLRRVIVVAEMAMAVTLLAGAGLLLRSFSRLMHVDTGFNPENVTTYNVSLPGERYQDPAAVIAFVDRLQGRLTATPGVTSSAISTDLPLDGRNFVISYTIHGQPPVPPTQEPSARIIPITSQYFATMGMKLLNGRAFTDADRAGSSQVAIVNESFVKKSLANDNPLGKYVELGWSDDKGHRGGTIVGVVADVKQTSLDATPDPTVYLPFTQAPRQSLAVAVRTSNERVSVSGALRKELAELDPTLPIYNMRPMSEVVATSVATERFYMVLLTAFAGVALLLSAVGLYGVIAYAVSQRTTELGVRVALGASRGNISRMIVREGLVMSVTGVVLGLGASIWLTKILTSLLFDITPSDPLTFGGVAAALILVAVSASWLPARRAAQADPLVAMRGDS